MFFGAKEHNRFHIEIEMDGEFDIGCDLETADIEDRDSEFIDVSADPLWGYVLAIVKFIHKDD